MMNNSIYRKPIIESRRDETKKEKKRYKFKNGKNHHEIIILLK